MNSDEKNKKNEMIKEQLEVKKKASTGPVNSLIDEKSLISKKARQAKSNELQKHMSTLNNLKRKLAKQIVDKSGKIEEFRQMNVEDLFQHAAEMERDRIKAREDKLNMFKNTDEEEREKLLEDRWQQKIERTLQSKV